MRIDRTGFSLLEVLAAMAVSGLGISFYLSFSGQTYTNINEVKGYLVATNVMENLYQDLSLVSSSNLAIGSFTLYYNQDGKALTTSTNAYYTVGVNVSLYSQLMILKNVQCTISWLNNGISRSIDFRVLK